MTKLVKSLLLIVIAMLFLSGCQVGSEFQKSIDDINQSVKQDDWKQTKQKVKKLKEMYEAKKWKLQLLGDEAEYEGINIELEKLKEAVEAKDKTQVKVGLGSIRGYLYDIYSF